MIPNHRSARLALYLFLLLAGACAMTPLSTTAQSNEGTEFWFSFLEHFSPVNNKACMLTSKYDAKGRIELPGTGWFADFQIPANDVVIIRVPDEAELLSSEQVERTAVRVTTDKPSSVYIHHYFDYRSDAALVLPVPSLGLQYYAMTYTAYQRVGTVYPSSIGLIATADGTDIQIRLSANTAGGASLGSTLQIRLNRGESYQIQGASVSDDLSGTYIQANKPIAVFSGNRWTQIPNGCGNRDNLLEQMFPIEVWGKRFVTVPSKNTSNDRFRIIAATDLTDITAYGKGNTILQQFQLNRGNWREFQLNAEASYIISSAPVMVAQFLVGGACNGHNEIGDPAMVLLNSLEQYRDTVTLYNSPFENILENYINVTMRSADTAGFTLDGQNLQAFNTAFETIGPQNEFAFAQIDVSSGPHVLIGGGCGVIAIAYGYGFRESYAYGGGANFTKINQEVPLPDGACLKDTVWFKTGLPEDKYAVEWDFGNGKHSTLHEDSQVYDQLGIYTVKLRITHLCLGTVDSTEQPIEITLRRDLTAFGDTVVCAGGELNLFANDRPGSRFSWKGPLDFSSDEQNPVIKNIQSDRSGIYTVTGWINGCASYPETLMVEVSENPHPDLGRDSFFCPGKGQLFLNPGNFYRYLWFDGSSLSEYPVEVAGSYAVEVSNESGCLGRDTIQIARICPVIIFVPNVFSPNGVQINDLFKPEIFEQTAYELEIFDRWGDLIFKTSDPETGWDGRFQGQAMLPGVYVYHIRYEGYDIRARYLKLSKSGDFTLIR
ncbi:MAG TPA: gliding motility-associated C-terminal domain-containing protein [Saprospiraceae bacterium]|nr:gliding motility-associated C-terminal domain-containing protein [Saprospiraceae bacterium]